MPLEISTRLGISKKRWRITSCIVFNNANLKNILVLAYGIARMQGARDFYDFRWSGEPRLSLTGVSIIMSRGLCSACHRCYWCYLELAISADRTKFLN